MSGGTPDQVFSDTKLLVTAGLRQPTTLEIYYEIVRRGLADGKRVPKNVLELVDTLNPPDLMWVRVPPEIREGDAMNIGVIYGAYAHNCPYEAVNATFLHIHAHRQAIVEMGRKGIRAGCITIYDMGEYMPEEFRRIMADYEIDIVGAMGARARRSRRGTASVLMWCQA